MRRDTFQGIADPTRRAIINLKKGEAVRIVLRAVVWK